MRNGLNISSVSELVHELRKSSREAEVRYDVEVQLRPDRLVGRPLTVHSGTIRIPRDFGLEGRRTGGAEGALPSATEYVPAAVVGSVLITVVHGASAKGVVLADLKAQAAARLRTGSDGDALDDLRVVLELEADCADSVIDDIGRAVQARSPNHRTAIEPNALTLTVDVHGADRVATQTMTAGADDDAAPLETAVDEIYCALGWEYGTQLAGHVWSAGRAERRPIQIDEPKQHLGLDYAPNPQEVLLVALGMDVLDGLGRSDAAAELSGARLTVGGSLDLRGLFGVTPEAEVGLHRLAGGLSLRVTGEAEPWLLRIERALRRSAVRRLVCNRHEIGFEVRVASR